MVSAQSDDAGLAAQRARVAQARFNRKTALADLSAAILRAPDHPEALYARGTLLLELSRSPEFRGEEESLLEAGVSDLQAACRLSLQRACTELRTRAQPYLEALIGKGVLALPAGPTRPR